MRCLIIKPEFAKQIMDGVKPVEMRTVKAKAPQRVAIAASKVQKILGMATILKCLDIEGLQCWFLEDVVKFKTPQTYIHKNGCVVWIDVPVDIDAPADKVKQTISHADFIIADVTLDDGSKPTRAMLE